MTLAAGAEVSVIDVFTDLEINEKDYELASVF